MFFLSFAWTLLLLLFLSCLERVQKKSGILLVIVWTNPGSFEHPVIGNVLVLFQNSGIEKAFLFDVMSKIYIATDSSPVDMQCYELCCDMIDVVMDMSGIYG